MSIASCTDLVTREEFEELKNQINQLLGQPEDENGEVINVLQVGSMSGTLIASGLTFDMELIENTANKTVEMFKKGYNGVSKKLGGATAKITKMYVTSKAAIEASGAAVGVSAGLITDVANLGISVSNLYVTKVLRDRINESENTILRMGNDFGTVYSHLAKTNANLEEANNNITELETNLTEAVANNNALKNSVSSQQLAIVDLETNFEKAKKNNAILKQNVETVETNLFEFELYATEEIGILKDNTKTLKDNLAKSKESREQIIEFTQQLGIENAKIKGDITEQNHRIEQLAFNQTFNRLEIQRLQSDLTNHRSVYDATVTSLGAKLRLMEDEIRRNQGVGGIPASVQGEIATQQNSLVTLASTLAGNPAEVENQTTGENIPVTANTTYSDIVSGNSNFADIFDGLLPNINTQTIGGSQVTSEELQAALTSTENNININTETTIAAILGTAVLPRLDTISNQTTPTAVRTATTQAVCDSTMPGGCLNTNVVNPISNSINGLGNGINAGLGSLNALLNNTILARLTTMQSFLDRAWSSTTVQKSLTTANTILAFHNATMLSRNLVQSVEDTMNLVLNNLPIPGFDDVEIEITQFVTERLTQFTQAVIGAENYTALVTGLNSANRILVAGQGVLSATAGIKNALQEGQEIIVNRVGTLGNAFLEQGILEDNTYPWMSTDTDFRSPFNGFTQRIEGITQFVDEVNQLVQSGIEVQENVNQLFDETGNAITASSELQTAFEEFDLTKREEDEVAEENSASPVIENADLVKNES